MKPTWIALMWVAAIGCNAHTNMRGSVVMKISEAEAHVCMGDREVSQGRRVRLYQNICKAPQNKAAVAGSVEMCTRKESGNGTVTKVLNEHYSVVSFEPGTRFQEGDTVETY